MEYRLIEIEFENPLKPFVDPVFSDRTRGHIEYDAVNWNCEFCGTCAKNCPADAITVDDKEFIWSIDRFSCVQCGCCVRTCLEKTKTLSMKPEYTAPAIIKSVNEYIAPEEDDDEDEFMD